MLETFESNVKIKKKKKNRHSPKNTTEINIVYQSITKNCCKTAPNLQSCSPVMPGHVCGLN